MNTERKNIGSYAFEARDGDPEAERIKEIGNAMNDAIPDGSNAGEVMGALGQLVINGFRFTHEPGDRLKAFDEWAKWHRGEIARALN